MGLRLWFFTQQTSNESLAEELALKTLAKAFDKLIRLKKEFNFKTWLISISKNVNIDHHRREKTVAQLDTTSIEKENFNTLYDDNPSPEDLLIINQNLKRLIEIIKELKPLYAKVIRLRYFEESSYKEIAEQTQLPINTLKVTLLRAKKFWRKNRRTSMEWMKKLGPGLLFAGAAIGVSHLVQSTRAGADFGWGLLWALLLANLFKYPFFEYGTRYALATGNNLLEGYAKLGKHYLWGYFLLNLATMFTIQTAVTIVTASLASILFGEVFNLVLWSAIITLSCLLIYGREITAS